MADKMDPQEAIKLISSMAAGQLGGMFKQDPKTGEVFTEHKDQSLIGMIPGMGTVRKPVSAKDLIDLAQLKSQSTPFSPAVTDFGAAFFKEAGSPEQLQAWQNLPPEAQSKMVGQLPGFRTKRQDAFSQTEILSNGEAIQKNINDGKYYYAGTQIPYEGEIKGQFLPKTQKNMSDATAIQLGKTQTLLNSIDIADRMLLPEKFGLWQGTFNKTIASYTNKDPEAAEMFRQLKTVFTEITHDLYGGTLTGNELDQATDLLFNQYQSFEAVKGALNVQRNKFTNRLENVSQLMKASNIRGAEAVKPTEPKAGKKAESKKSSTDLGTPDGIKAAFKAGTLSREQAKALLKATVRGK